jgi:hypothetical protein
MSSMYLRGGGHVKPVGLRPIGSIVAEHVMQVGVPIGVPRRNICVFGKQFVLHGDQWNKNVRAVIVWVPFKPYLSNTRKTTAGKSASVSICRRHKQNLRCETPHDECACPANNSAQW